MNSCPRLDGARVAPAFLLAPALAPISAILVTYAATKEHSGDCLFGGIALVMVFFGFPFSYISALVLGLPYICVMHKKEHLNLWTIMGGGLVLWAGLCAFLWVLPSKDLRVLRYYIAPLSLVGILVECAFFYCVALRGGESRDMNLRTRLDGRRLALAFLLAPAVAPVAVVLVAYATKGHNSVYLLDGIVHGMVFFGLPLSYITALVLGIPYIYVMQKRGYLNFWTILSGGFALWVGSRAFLWMAPPSDLRVLRHGLAYLSLIGILLEAVFFYCVALWWPKRLRL